MGKIADGILGAIFGKTKTSLRDSGLQFDAATVGQIAGGGAAVRGYQDIQIKKSGFLGMGGSTKYKTVFGGVEADITNQFAGTIRNISDLLVSSVGALGEDAVAVRNRLQSTVVNVGRISLKDLSSSEISAQIEAVFSQISDNLAAVADNRWRGFQKSGEGYLETLVRLSSAVEQAKYYTDRLGLSQVNLASVWNQQGDAAAELVRQSIMAREGLSGISQIVYDLQGDASTLFDTYKQLTEARTALKGLGVAAYEVTYATINGAGSIDALTSGIGDFVDGFYAASDSIRAQRLSLTDQFSVLGKALPGTKDEFRKMVEGLDTTKEADQRLLGSLLSLSGGFAKLMNSVDAYENSKLEMQIAILRAQSKETEAVALERKRTLEATDPMLKALQQEVFAAQDAAEATAKLNDSLEKLKDAGRTIADYLDTLNTKDSPTDNLAATRSNYLQNLTLARTDDLTALGKVTSLATAYLTAAESGVSTSAQYQAIVAQVKAELGGLNATQSYYASVNGSHASGLSYVPFDGYIAELHKGERVQTAAQVNQEDALAAELARMRADLKAALEAIAGFTQQTSKTLNRWEGEGLPAERAA